MGDLSSHVRYFGFYADGFEVDATGVVASRRINDIKPFTNTVWISVADSTWLGNLALAAGNGQKVILTVTPWFFTQKGALLDLNAYRSRWEQAKTQLAPYVQDIAAFYPMDEPYTQPDMALPSAVQRRKDLQVVIATIKQTYPSIPAAVIFSAPSISPGLQIPVGYDWVGLDCYGDWNRCRSDQKSMLWHFHTLEKMMTPKQHMILAPDAALLNNSRPAQHVIDALQDRIDHYLSYAANDPRVIGIFPFIYQTFQEGPNRWTGAHDLPQILSLYVEVGHLVLKTQSERRHRPSSAAKNHRK